jgi:hypothetical protein
MSETQKVQAKIRSDELVRKGTRFQLFGVGLAILSFLSWVTSVTKREPTWRLLPLVLLGCYLCMLILMVV